MDKKLVPLKITDLHGIANFYTTVLDIFSNEISSSNRDQTSKTYVERHETLESTDDDDEEILQAFYTSSLNFEIYFLSFPRKLFSALFQAIIYVFSFKKM